MLKVSKGGFMNKVILLILITYLSTVVLLGSRNASLNVVFSVPDVQSIQVNETMINFSLNYGGHAGMLYEPRTVNTTYNITSTGNNKRLLARLNQNMPNNIFLEMKADPPQNANTMGYIALDTTQKALVTNINSVHQQNLLMYFRLRADIGAPVTLNENRVITFTISD